MQKNLIPIKGQEYHFFDDGKISFSRHYMATVVDIIKPEQAKNTIIEKVEWDGVDEYIDEISLYDIWISEKDSHHQTENFKVINGSSTEPGAPWLYAEETDYFIKCYIPEYDENDIWFVRDVHGGWFSMNTVRSWMTGQLDITGKLYEQLKNDCDETQKF